MSRVRRILTLIRRKLPGVELCKNVLVVVPTESILRGFTIEATMEKGRIYFWRIVLPLYEPLKGLPLSYSNRVTDEGDIFVDERAYQQSADRLRGIINQHWDYLQNIRGPEDFLRHISWMMENKSFNFRWTLALTYFKCGKVRECRDLLQPLVDEVEQGDWSALRKRHVRQAVDALEQGEESLAALLDQWEEQNVEMMGLQPSRLSPAAQLPPASERL